MVTLTEYFPSFPKFVCAFRNCNDMKIYLMRMAVFPELFEILHILLVMKETMLRKKFNIFLLCKTILYTIELFA